MAFYQCSRQSFIISKKLINSFSLLYRGGSIKAGTFRSLSLEDLPMYDRAIVSEKYFGVLNITHTKTAMQIGEDSKGRPSFFMQNINCSMDCFEVNPLLDKAMVNYSFWNKFLIHYDLTLLHASKVRVASEISTTKIGSYNKVNNIVY